MVTTAVAAGAALPSGAAPDPAVAEATATGWVPAPTVPWERPAGVICDFAVRAEPVVDEVMKLVLDEFPDGTPQREIYTGDLVMRVTNLETGAYTDADASGDALIEYHEDGSSTWYVRGPVLMGGRDTGGNLPRGYWRVDGLFTADIAANGEKTVTMVHGTQHDVCTDID
ncbi:hypothetical protein E1269_27510 [Jiangella asiatica]|uniref:Uncharacterized protein n=1 Tax=Jiangella asiatica TaxID=2530372 RepID=A0A4R5CL27_9ACTN|nr:hypothetical protein E1269_27510 [Jiangella asiatica]